MSLYILIGDIFSVDSGRGIVSFKNFFFFEILINLVYILLFITILCIMISFYYKL